MKLQDLTDQMFVQTTPENHRRFIKLLDEKGFSTWANESLFFAPIWRRYNDGFVYNVKAGYSTTISSSMKIIQADEILKHYPSLEERVEMLKKEIKELEESKMKILEQIKELNERFQEPKKQL